MKVLLDESVPRKLKNDFPIGHEIWSVRDKGWLGAKNGVLLALMEQDAFDIFVTVDQNLSYQQNLKQFPVWIFVLCGTDNRRETLAKMIPEIFERIANGILEPVNVIRQW